MLGIPSGFGLAGVPFLVVGILVVAISSWRRRASFPSDVVGRAASACVLFTLAVTPYLAYRIAEDIRVTSSMSAYDLRVAGPVQAYLQPYLLDPLRTIIPPGDTYATVTGPGVPLSDRSRDPFRPRHDDALPAEGDRRPSPSRLGHRLGHAAAARRPRREGDRGPRAQGGYPAVLVGRVRR